MSQMVAIILSMLENKYKSSVPSRSQCGSGSELPADFSEIVKNAAQQHPAKKP
jgi:hypothetical protein